jgi:hypothetical protein
VPRGRFFARRGRLVGRRIESLPLETLALTLEHTDPDARVLVVTNMWPRPEKPSYGIFVKRQVDSLIEAGLRCDVLFIHGYRSRLAYPLGALKLLTWNWRRDRRYELVHGHGGEIALAARFYFRARCLGDVPRIRPSRHAGASRRRPAGAADQTWRLRESSGEPSQRFTSSLRPFSRALWGRRERPTRSRSSAKNNKIRRPSRGRTPTRSACRSTSRGSEFHTNTA